MLFAHRGGSGGGGGGGGCVARTTQGDRLGARGVQPLHARVVGRVQCRRAAAHTNLHGEGMARARVKVRARVAVRARREGEGERGGEGEGGGRAAVGARRAWR